MSIRVKSVVFIVSSIIISILVMLYFKWHSNKYVISYGEKNITTYHEYDKTKENYYNGWEKEYLNLSQNNYTGKGVKVAVLDTRVTASDIHPVSFSDRSSLAHRESQTDLHGDGITRVITEIAPNVQIYNAIVANDSGIVQLDSFVTGLEWAINEKVDIINMSINFKQGDSRIDKLLIKAYNTGIILVASVGNEGAPTVSYPATSPYVIGVGSIGIDSKRLDFSNYGNEVSFCTPGKYIKTGRIDNLESFHQGTSISSAVLSGILARLKEESLDLNQSAAIERLKSLTKVTNKSMEYGYGIPKF